MNFLTYLIETNNPFAEDPRDPSSLFGRVYRDEWSDLALFHTELPDTTGWETSSDLHRLEEIKRALNHHTKLHLGVINDMITRINRRINDKYGGAAFFPLLLISVASVNLPLWIRGSVAQIYPSFSKLSGDLQRRIEGVVNLVRQQVPELALYHDLHDRCNALRKQQKAAKQAAKQGAAAKSGWAPDFAGGNTIPPGKVPVTIDTGTSKLKNPYHLFANQRYAGDPYKFPFSTPSLDTFLTINAALKRNGIPEIDTLYAANYTPTSCLNFIGVNPTDTVVWYKYDRGGGTGQNYLYINGTKIQTTHLTLLSEPQQDALLKKLHP